MLVWTLIAYCRLAANRSDGEMAEELGVPDKVISHLRHHFETVGIYSILGRTDLLPCFLLPGGAGDRRENVCLSDTGFDCCSFIELALLIKVGSTWGCDNYLLVIGTGINGAALAKLQGLRIL